MNLEGILEESDLTEYSGEIIFKNEYDLHTLSKRNDFLLIIEKELKKSVSENRLNRFCFISHLLLAFGSDSLGNQSIYCNMIDFVNDSNMKRSAKENEQILEVVLDLFWHQDNGLKDLNQSQQYCLNQFLRFCANHKFETDENGSEIFFAIKKSISLIKYQKDIGKTDDLINVYINHFDSKIRQETIELNYKNWPTQSLAFSEGELQIEMTKQINKRKR